MRRSTIVVGAGLAATGAGAQQLPPDNSLVQFNRYVAVGERPLPGYDAKGLPLGLFTLSPSLDIGADYNDNIFAVDARDTPRTNDVALRVAPAALLITQAARGAASINVQGTIDRFADNKTENRTAFNGSGYVTREFGQGTRVRAIVRYQTDRESRESQNAFALTVRPIKYDQATIAGGVTQRFNNVQLALETGLTRLNFDDGRLRGSNAVLDQQYRDNDVFRLRARAEIAQSPSLAYFVQATRDKADYRTQSTLGQQRNSTGYELLGGARFELPVLVRGEIGLGYQNTSYRDDRFRKFAGLAINSRLQFFPTQLTTVTFTAQRSVSDAGTPNSSGYVALIGGARVDHELLRQLILGASVDVERDSYNGIDRRDRRFAVGASARYQLNPNLSLRAAFDRLDLGSRGVDRYKAFVRNRVTIALGLRV